MIDLNTQEARIHHLLIDAVAIIQRILSLLLTRMRNAGRYLRLRLTKCVEGATHFALCPKRETEWTDILDRVISDILQLNRTTEGGFLAIGGKLMEFRSAARQISSEMAGLSELISGEQATTVTRALAGVLQHSELLDTQARKVSTALADIRDLTSRIPPAFAELRVRVLSFRTLCTLTRIETCRLGQVGADLEGLANAVKPLSERIHLTGERVLKAASQLDDHVRMALLSGGELQNQQLANLRLLIDNVLQSLRSFEERRLNALQCSIRQGEQHEAICAAVDNLVESVQFHDITRQQIEHVADSLRKFRAKHVKRANSGLPRHAQAILDLQISQLSSAEDSFVASVERMQKSLEDISAHISQMGKDSRTLMGFAVDERESFFFQMEDSLNDILTAIRSSEADAFQMGSMAQELAGTIARMQQSVVEIRGIEIQIQRIAINATIRAAQIDTAGNALNTIADAMHRIVLESSGNTEDAAQALVSMKVAVSRVSADGDAAQTSSRTGPVLNDMNVAVRELRLARENSATRVNRIADLGSDLAAQIQTALANFTAGKTFVRVVTHARAELQRITIAGDSRTVSDETNSVQTNLDTFAHHYTMQIERDVHQGVAGIPKIPQPAPLNGNLGENVELF